MHLPYVERWARIKRGCSLVMRQVLAGDAGLFLAEAETAFLE
jgi:hypothetical protein